MQCEMLKEFLEISGFGSQYPDIVGSVKWGEFVKGRVSMVTWVVSDTQALLVEGLPGTSGNARLKTATASLYTISPLSTQDRVPEDYRDG